MLEFICYERCSTCRKAKEWLIKNNIQFNQRDIKTLNPTADEIAKWAKLSLKPLKKFFNTSGILYRENNIKQKLSSMSDSEIITLLASDGMMVKRPIIVGKDFVLIGFDENEWAKKLL